ncbi:HAD-IIIC family phosphatase [Micromonospora sp. WMMD987]|uniref:HAD-IIIC family phosphatase n=1 Tax=Micromonospora sp. WMMD987 TaxID=3016089 RepID=UPI00249CCED5|nr:HAD-IIIC family phosphatase [Micromonospora sp. WMMD987]WFE96106.1 HAD-IIIC family phosphatase [Micromonospora sp. WMMD987]
MSVDQGTPPAPTTGRVALAGLRATLADTPPDLATVRELLDRVPDPLDLEAAGRLLRGARGRAALADADLPRTRLALLGSSTMDALPPMITAAAFRRGILAEIRMAGFNQWQLEIAAGAPELSTLRPRLVGCLLDDAAVFDRVADPVDLDEVEARCAAFPAELAAWVTAARDTLGGLVVLTTVPLHPLRSRRLVSYAARARLAAAWSTMNAGLAALAADLPSTVVLDHGDLAEAAGGIFADHRMRQVAGHAYAPGYLLAYAEELSRVAAADLGRAAKCLVLDLDNTLWDGVVGDVGTAGLRIGGSYPGTAHTELQRLALDLCAQGVLLAVSSKNDEPVAVEALDNHPEMLLRSAHLVARRIDWEPKAGNVRAMAVELNLGSDAFVFVDDNPVERELMRRMAPEVTTVELPDDPAGYAAALAARGDFLVLSVTDEDRDRTTLYRRQARRREVEQQATSLADHLARLGTRLTVEPCTPVNAGRITQLFAKTNQCNLTGVRYGAGEVDRSGTDGAPTFFTARLGDTFGDHGLIAAIALDRATDGSWRIGNFVLSCRVFSRGVEGTLLGLVLRAAVAAGAPGVTGTFRPTDRNGRFADLYPSLGFHPTGDAGGFRHDLARLPDLSPFIEITHEPEVFRVG